MTTLKTMTVTQMTRTTTSSATASDRRQPAHLVELKDACGGTPLSAFALSALVRYGPGWFWRQAIRPRTRN
jgi:hypothetical protein